MCDPMTIGAVLKVGATVFSVGSQIQQQQYQRGTDRYNARVAENEAQRTRNKGVEAENIHRQKTAQLISKQRAQIGAAGVELGSGSALQLQEETAVLGEADALRIRSSFEEKAESLETQASLLKNRGGGTSAGTILGAVALGGVASSWFTPDSAANQIEGQTGFTGGAGGVLTGEEFATF